MNPELLKKFKNLQKELENKQAELAAKEFVVEKQGIKIIALGNNEIKSIELDEMLIDPDDKDLLQDLLVVAFNELIDKIKKEQDEMTPAIPGGLPF
ncbi:YbaB/EbfC family nucleoid-associated protein [Mycoplasmopsis bovirhinis]|uniref:YbaB/EbfC family nucleoid-associated protein n=1 Tax=Mycoplasmopsis bovirhinis TaxID=29553 RepID=UPI000E713491|nr:YbaB/EbfC family nucleoid-associated protein [Mycoplasmopsis bovirhinis]